MKVLALVHQYVPVHCAGAETHIHEMLRALALRGHRVDVVLSDQRGEPYELDGVNVWPTVNHRTDFQAWLPDADVVITHLDNSVRATVLGKFNDTPVVCVHHNTFDAAKDNLLLPAGRTDLVAVNSQHMADDLEAFLRSRSVSGPPTVIVRPTADPAEYSTTPGDKVTLINLRRRDDRHHRDHLSKGGELFRELAERMPDVEFLGVTGSYGTQQELEGLSNVEVIPHVPHDQMRELVYARTRVLLIPSSYESWGRVASEAMCSGIPVIASPTPGLLEQLDYAGMFAPPGYPSAWIVALQHVLKLPHWREMSLKTNDRAKRLHAIGQADLGQWVSAVERTVAENYIRSIA